MKKIFILLIALVSFASATEHKVVFDLTSKDVLEVQNRLIKNITILKKYYAKKGDSLKVAVVISGGAYPYFIKDLDKSPYAKQISFKILQPYFKKELKRLSDEGVVFEVCGMGLKKRKIKPKVLYPYVKVAFIQSAALIEWENKGYSYYPVH